LDIALLDLKDVSKMRVLVILSFLTFGFNAFAEETELARVVAVKSADAVGANQKSSPAASRQSPEATAVVQKFFGGLKTPSPVIPPLVEDITTVFNKEAPGWQVSPAATEMAAASPRVSETRSTDVARVSQTAPEPQSSEEPPAPPRVSESRSTEVASASTAVKKTSVAPAQKPANLFAAFKSTPKPEKVKPAKQPLLKNWFTKKARSGEISVEK